jgi:hypothetical protein
MKRRDFLKASAALSSTLLLPRSLHADPTTPLWVHLHAGGGWDPTMLCDPNPEVNNLLFSVQQTTQTNAGETIAYAGLGGDDIGFSKNTGYGFGTFFETYKNQMLVLNGVNPQTAGHFSGARFAASGKLDAGYPSIFALAAALGGPEKAMAYIVGASASYSVTGGHVPETRLSSNQYLDDAINPNSLFNNTQVMYREDEYALLNAAKAARLQRLISAETNLERQHTMSQFSDARAGTPLLQSVTSALAEGPYFSRPNSNNNNRLAYYIFDNGLRALIGYEMGLTVAASLNAGVFDTHGDHDILHPSGLQNALMAIDWLLQEAQLRALPMVIVVTSEFGRTANYNVADGKDHWPNTSWMLFQTSDLNLFNAGRTIGASTLDTDTWKIHSNKLDPATLLPTSDEDENGVYLTPDLIHLSLREIMGISGSTYANHLYRIDGDPLTGIVT